MLEASAFFYDTLRKPDFQRETASWSPDTVANFISSFLAGDLIPAIILWKSFKNVFVIDGAHRLGALLAWVHDDYGDGKISRNFFDNMIPPEQATAAEKTRALVKKQVGTYEEHTAAVKHGNAREEVKDRATRLGSLSVQLQ